MGINEINFNPFNPIGDYSVNVYNQSYGTDFNAFNPSSTGYINASNFQQTCDTVSLQLKKEIDDVVHLTQNIETELNKKYPNGFKLVGLGRSPSLIIELMREKGYDAKTCALSGLMTGEYDISGKYPYLNQLDSIEVKKYGEYLKELGISADEIKNSTKPTVFVDYTRTGQSLRSFQELLARSEIGINENVNFLSLNRDLLPNQSVNERKIIDRLWENLGIKNFSFVPRVEISQLGQAKEITQNFKPSEIATNFLKQAIKILKMCK